MSSALEMVQKGNRPRLTNFSDRWSTVEHGLNRPGVSKNWRTFFAALPHQSDGGMQGFSIILVPVYFFWVEMQGNFGLAWRGARPSWAIVGS